MKRQMTDAIDDVVEVCGAAEDACTKALGKNKKDFQAGVKEIEEKNKSVYTVKMDQDRSTDEFTNPEEVQKVNAAVAKMKVQNQEDVKCALWQQFNRL